MPAWIARVMPPSSSTSSISSCAARYTLSVRLSMKYEPPQGSTTAGIPDSSWRISCVLRATRAAASVGRLTASS